MTKRMVIPVRDKILNPKRKYDSFTYSIIELLLAIYYILGRYCLRC